MYSQLLTTVQIILNVRVYHIFVEESLTVRV